MTTINDIAKMAGVSTSTVSHVVNKTRYVSPELVERVNKIINQLDSPPNFVNKKSKKYSSSTKYILFLISDKRSSVQKQVEHHVEELLTDSEYTLLTLYYSLDDKKLELIKSYLFHTTGISGIILFPDDNEENLCQMLSDVHLPIVMLGRELKNFKTDSIVADTFEGAYKATKHLIKSGHERISFLHTAQERNPKRLEGYKGALEDYHIEFNSVFSISPKNTETENISILEEMFSEENMPTAIIAANSYTMVPLLEYIETHNILCPQDVSIVSLNDFEWAPLHTPSITCVRQNSKEAANLAVSILTKRINNGEYANAPLNVVDYKHFVLSMELVVRSSTQGIGRGPFGEKAESMDTLRLSDNEIKVIREQQFSAAISFHYAGKAWMQLTLKGIRDIFEKLNISLIATTDAHFDPELQNKQLASLKFLDPDVIIAIPTDNVKTAEAFKNIVESRTKLVLISNVPAGITPKDYVSCISVNEHSHGRNMGLGLGEYMIKHNLKNVGLINHGVENFYSTKQRDRAAEQVLLEEYPEIKICGSIAFGQEKDVYRLTTDFIKRYPMIEALYVSWDGPAMEVLSALADANRTDIVVVTGDLDFPCALNLAKGGMIKMLSAQTPFEQGQALALAAANSLLGKTTPSFIGLEPKSVTSENLLKSWQQVFKEEAPAELKLALKQNPNYVSK
ncbi:MAG TPA: substrate-binding domain-containing protein [Clostridiales bacterium]|nr:substrate-binding domain-containing protein [Clostridiales bacterium]